MSSLGGKNSTGRSSGARSSRASSTLFYTLRNLDVKISLLDKEILFYFYIFDKRKVKILQSKRENLDKKRLKIRNKRKYGLR